MVKFFRSFPRKRGLTVTAFTVVIFVISQWAYLMYLAANNTDDHVYLGNKRLLQFSDADIQDPKDNLAEIKLHMFKENIDKLVKEFNSYMASIQPKKREKDICKRYFSEGMERRVVISQIWKNVTKQSYDDVTLVTQMGEQKIPVLEMLLEHWEGPMSVAVYINTSTTTNTTLAVANSSRLLSRDNVKLHLVANHGEFYPVNYMRNVALNHTSTKYVYLADVDFMPNYHIHRYIRSLLRNNTLREKEVYVVPAFEFPHKENVTTYPRSKAELLDIWKTKNVMQFHWKFSPGHGATNYKKWKTAKYPYTVKFHDGYEPYIVMRRDETPLFDTSFVGRYGNKISHLFEVYSAGFDFVVLPEAYTIHYPHFVKWNVGYMGCSVKAIKAFKENMKKKYKPRKT